MLIIIVIKVYTLESRPIIFLPVCFKIVIYNLKEHNHSHKRSVNDFASPQNTLNSIDNDKIELFLNSIYSRNKLNTELIKSFLEFNKIQVEATPSHKIKERASYNNYNAGDRNMNELFQNSISYNNRPLGKIYKRDVSQNANIEKDKISGQVRLKEENNADKELEEESNHVNHSSIGFTLVIGFIFMLVMAII